MSHLEGFAKTSPESPRINAVVTRGQRQVVVDVVTAFAIAALVAMLVGLGS
jgi:hypothetical protein